MLSIHPHTDATPAKSPMELDICILAETRQKAPETLFNEDKRKIHDKTTNEEKTVEVVDIKCPSFGFATMSGIFTRWSDKSFSILCHNMFVDIHKKWNVPNSMYLN